MGLFGKSKREQELEAQNAMLKSLLMQQNTKKKTTSAPTQKQVVWQCRYCGIKNTRWQSNGMPDPGFCNKNGKMGGPKGPHRWVKIMTK